MDTEVLVMCFGRWATKTTYKYVFSRVNLFGLWTPFCWRTNRRVRIRIPKRGYHSRGPSENVYEKE